MLLGLAEALHANLFLAAFTGGITVAALTPQVERSFNEFGELVTELLKLAAILVFGALVSPAFLADVPLLGYVFAVLAIVLARPLAIAVALVRSPLPRGERVVAAWFGPKGFASIVYGLLVLDAGLVRSDELFHVIALVVTLSIFAHSSTDSSTDVPIAHAFARQAERRSEADTDVREWRELEHERQSGGAAAGRRRGQRPQPHLAAAGRRPAARARQPADGSDRTGGAAR